MKSRKSLVKKRRRKTRKSLLKKRRRKTRKSLLKKRTQYGGSDIILYMTNAKKFYGDNIACFETWNVKESNIYHYFTNQDTKNYSLEDIIYDFYGIRSINNYRGFFLEYVAFNSLLEVKYGIIEIHNDIYESYIFINSEKKINITIICIPIEITILHNNSKKLFKITFYKNNDKSDNNYYAFFGLNGNIIKGCLDPSVKKTNPNAELIKFLEDLGKKIENNIYTSGSLRNKYNINTLSGRTDNFNIINKWLYDNNCILVISAFLKE